MTARMSDDAKALDGAQALVLTPLERAAGLVAGPYTDADPLPPAPDARSPRQVLEDVIAASLARTPCVVSFSGGRDSSSVLAIAVAVARREGLPLPVPVSLRFPGTPSTDETEWQELVIRHLGVTDWERIVIGAELDLLGDIACGCLRRHGLLWPPNAYFHEPIFRASRGGCVLTGLDGDGLFGAWRWEAAQSALSRRRALRPKDLLRVGLALVPPSIRRIPLRRGPPPVPWLRPGARADFLRVWIGETAAEPRRWDRRMTWYHGRRYLRLARHSLGVIAAATGAEVSHPLAEPSFLAALAGAGGAAGLGGRTDLMRALFGDLLPDALISRPRKAEFGRALWLERARDFARDWDGTGVDATMVDPGELRRVWGTDNPWFGSITPLHAAWLAQTGTRSVS